jgi:hypothetical protein
MLCHVFIDEKKAFVSCSIMWKLAKRSPTLCSYFYLTRPRSLTTSRAHWHQQVMTIGSVSCSVSSTPIVILPDLSTFYFSSFYAILTLRHFLA